MPMTQVKICGVTTPDALDAAIAARAEYVGLMFFAPSPRNLSFAQANALAARADAAIERVGVFVEPADDLLREAIAAGILDALQVHRVTAARRGEIAARFGLPGWAGVEVSKPADLAARHHLEACDRVIFDAKTPGGALPGGMGLAFDWSMLAGLSHAHPWGLAGGLGPTNVAEAIRMTGAPMVDASSGLESATGVKDPDRIRAFVAAARSL